MSFDDLVAGIDRAAFDALGGELVTYAPAVGQAVQVTGLFDANYLLMKGSSDLGVEGLGPMVFFRLADLPTDPRADTPTITIRGVAYSVTERRPDDAGGIVLQLRGP